MWEEHLHLSYGLLAGHLVLAVLIDFLDKLRSVVNHFFHCTLLCKLSIFIAVFAVFLGLASIGISAVVVHVIERHSAALTKSLFCFHNLFIYSFATAKVVLIYLSLQQLPNLSEVQVQMVDVAAYHCVESHTAALVVNPVVVELGLINRADDMADVLIIVFQQHHTLVPILMLIILEFYPQVVVLGVVRKHEHPHLGVGH